MPESDARSVPLTFTGGGAGRGTQVCECEPVSRVNEQMNNFA